MWFMLYISKNPLEKTNFFLVGSCQLEITSLLGIGTYVNFLSQCQDNIWLWPVKLLACCHYLSEYIYESFLLYLKTLFSLALSILYGSYNLSACSFA